MGDMPFLPIDQMKRRSAMQDVISVKPVWTVKVEGGMRLSTRSATKADIPVITYGLNPAEKHFSRGIQGTGV